MVATDQVTEIELNAPRASGDYCNAAYESSLYGRVGAGAVGPLTVPFVVRPISASRSSPPQYDHYAAASVSPFSFSAW